MQTLNTEELQQQLNNTSTELINTFSLFTKEQFNKIPFEGSWTAAQVAEHLYKSEKGISGVLNGATKTAARPANEKLQQLMATFLDNTIKFEASESLKPSDDQKNKTALIELISNNKAIISNLASTLDLSELCVARQMPVLGELTRYEWLWFVVFHNTRHILQVKNIQSILSQQ